MQQPAYRHASCSINHRAKWKMINGGFLAIAAFALMMNATKKPEKESPHSFGTLEAKLNIY